jgi:hypothetical protein
MKHPNATAAAGGSTVGVILAALLAAFGVNVNPVALVAVSGVITTAVLFVGRNGIQGAWDALWHGEKEKP